jgi:hypothetical protein
MLRSSNALLGLMSLEQQEAVYQARTGDFPEHVGYWRRFGVWAEANPRKELQLLEREDTD